MRKPTLKTYRRAFQIFIAVAFIVIPILNRSRYSYVYGNFLSFHMFGIPFADPLAVLQLSIKNLYLTLDNVFGALLSLLLAFFLGTVFCSWICPFGLLSEFTQGLSKKVMGRNYKGLALTWKGFPLKMTIFILGFIAFFIFSTTPVLNQLSMPAWYARFFQYYFGQDFISLSFLFLLALLIVEFAARRRIWCRYICPQSILIILSKQLNRNRLKVVFDQEKCICKPGHERCETACSLSLHPKILYEQAELECSNCGDCVVACKKMGKALSFTPPRINWVARYWQKIHFPGPRKIVTAVLALAVLSGLGVLVFHVTKSWKSPAGPHKEVNAFLDNKRLAWDGGRAEYYEFLPDGTLICVGGDWPVNGFKGGRWQSVDENGSFKMIFDPTRPDSYVIAGMNGRIGKKAQFTLVYYEDNIRTKADDEQHVMATYEPLRQSHAETAVTLDATVVLNRYAEDVYVLDLRVQDPRGEIKKILTEGDVITNEVMLTNVKYWLNTPQIIVSEGMAPKLPIRSKMRILFHDGHEESASFITDTVFDRSSEEFDDPWF
jgi:ferredoxin-type protein NapH